jgi:hypothetical protein
LSRLKGIAELRIQCNEIVKIYVKLRKYFDLLLLLDKWKNIEFLLYNLDHKEKEHLKSVINLSIKHNEDDETLLILYHELRGLSTYEEISVIDIHINNY